MEQTNRSPSACRKKHRHSIAADLPAPAAPAPVFFSFLALHHLFFASPPQSGVGEVKRISGRSLIVARAVAATGLIDF